jgi:Leucine-rich repeat (LRR) protein
MHPGINDLEPFAVTNLPKLVKLHLNGNKLKTIKRDALIDLGSRNVPLSLHVDKNELAEVPEDFLNLPHLDLLYLQVNSIEYIHPAAFRLNPILNKIELSDNKLERIEEGTFNSPFLNYLSLDGNRITKLLPRAFRQGATVFVL